MATDVKFTCLYIATFDPTVSSSRSLLTLV